MTALSNQHHKINYLEIAASDIHANKKFFSKAFSWSFEDYGAEYCAFSDDTINGGFYKIDKNEIQRTSAVLIVFYSQDLTASQKTIEQAGGIISKKIFSFPGGKRFHFLDPSKNEYAVWSE